MRGNAASRGRVLFEDDTTATGRPRWYRGAMGIVLMGLGIVLAAISAWLALLAGPGSSITAILFLPLIAVMVLLMGVLMFAQERGKRIFTIHETGLLLPNTPLMDALKGRDRFVTWPDVDRFEIEPFPIAPQARFLRVRIKGDTTALLLGDNWGAIDLLDRAFPAKCTPELRRLAAETRGAHSSNIAERAKSMRSSAVATILMMGGFAVFLTLMIGALIGPSASGPILVVMSCVLLLVDGMFVWAMALGERRLREATALLRSRAEPGGVVVAQTLVARLSGAKEEAIAYRSIREARLLVTAFFFDPYCRVTFADGRRRDLPLEVMHACRGTPEFRDEGPRLVNTAPASLDASPLATKALIPVGIACVAMLAAFFGGVLVSASFAGTSGGINVWLRIGQLVLLLVLLPLYLVARVVLRARTAREATTAVIQWDTLILYDPEQNRTTVPFAEIKEVRDEDGLSGKSAKLVLKDGREIPVPLRYATDLRQRVAFMAAFPLSGAMYPEAPSAPPTAFPTFPPVATPPLAPRSSATFAGPIKPGDQIVPTSIRRDRGRLLLREDEQTLQARKRSFVKVGTVLATIGAACVALMVAAAALSWSIGYVGWLMLFMFALLFIAFGWALVFSGRRAGAVAVHENGIAVPANVGRGDYFFPWGMIDAISESQNSIDGAYYMLRAKDGTPIALKRTIPGLEALMPMVRDRIGRPEFAGEIEKPSMDTFYGRTAYLLVVVTLAISFGTGGYLGFSFADSFGTWGAAVLGLGIIAPLICMLMLPYVTKRIGDMVKKQNVRRGPPAALVFVPLAICAAIFFASASQAHEVMAGPADYPRSLLPEPAGLALSADTMDNFTLAHQGFVVAKAGKTIALSNGTLRFGSPAGPRTSGFYVSPGGRLILRNVTVEPDGADGWTAQIYGRADITDSRIVRPYGDKSRDNEFGGIEIYSSDVRVEGNRFEGSASNLIFTADSSPVVKSNIFTGAKADAAQVHGGAPHFENNTFEKNYWGAFLLARTEAVFRGNRFIDNENGMSIVRASPVIEGNTFSGTEDRGLVWDATSQPKIGTNTHVGPNDVPGRTEGSGYADACVTAGVILVFVGFVGSYLAWRSTEQELRRRRTIDQSPPGPPVPVPVGGPLAVSPSAFGPPPQFSAPIPPMPPLVQCPRCRGAAELVAQYGRYFCRQCAAYV